MLPVLLEVALPVMLPLTLTLSEVLVTAAAQRNPPPPVVVLATAKAVALVEPVELPLTETDDVIVGIWFAASPIDETPPAPPTEFRMAAMLAEPVNRFGSEPPPILSGDAITRPRKSGRLNVVEPSPTPKVVLISENRVEYVDRLMACP